MVMTKFTNMEGVLGTLLITGTNCLVKSNLVMGGFISGHILMVQFTMAGV